MPSLEACTRATRRKGYGIIAGLRSKIRCLSPKAEAHDESALETLRGPNQTLVRAV